MAQIELSKDVIETNTDVIVGTSVLGVPLALTAIRCTLQYILVPFILPLFGIGGLFSPLVNVAAGVLGVGVILFNLKRLWHSNWRVRYLGLSLVIVPFILVSMYFDYIAYLASN